MNRPAPAILEVEGLHVVFGHGADAVHAVRDVSFRVAEGETLGLVGESGSGKTTVLRAIAGLVVPAAGRITVAGEPQGPHRPRGFARTARCTRATPWTGCSWSPSPSTGWRGAARPTASSSARSTRSGSARASGSATRAL